MSKTVLVIDMPKMCMGCPFAYPVDDFSYACVASEDEDGGYKVISNNSYDKKVEDWCPLMDLPEKDNGDYPANTFDAGFVEGWNQCIDEITGGEVDGEIN